MDIDLIFDKAAKKLQEEGRLPEGKWLNWEFMRPKLPDRGDLCSFTVLRTTFAMKKAGIDCDAQEWCLIIIEALASEEMFEKLYAENGIINVILKHKAPENEEVKEGLSEDDTFKFESIGYISSCYSEKFGTPRQSLYSKYARGVVHLKPLINMDSFDGIEDFSHIWLVFVFHQSKHSKFKTKIKPPRLEGEKKGIFATRAPHRYNPIGLSLVRLDKVEDRKIWVSGIDLIDKTPILDIKPYHPVDCLPEYRCPEYIERPIFVYVVEFHENSLSNIEEIKKKFKLEFYSNDEDWTEVIRETLAQDPSTVHTKMKHQVDAI